MTLDVFAIGNEMQWMDAQGGGAALSEVVVVVMSEVVKFELRGAIFYERAISCPALSHLLPPY